MDVENMTNEELIGIFYGESGIYTGEVMEEICRRADMTEEYEEADGDNFVRVVQNACWVLEEFC
jgi:hypothetical protein